jgi:sugar lactone lactonase YvrE
MKIRYFILIPIVLLFVYLLFYPVSIEPQVWQPPKAPALEGEYQQNDKLSAMRVLFEGQCEACEDVALDSMGNIYGGQVDGKIIRFKPDNGKREVFADTKGRPLGMHFDSHGNLIIADIKKGLLSINSDGEITVLTTGAKGRAFGFTDDLEIGEDGIIYFSDASWKYSGFEEDIMEHNPNGSLLSYNPETKETKVLLDELFFGNGIAVSHDQDYVLVVETSAYRIRRYWLKGDKAGQSDIFIDNLPGFPDGVSQGADGMFWVAIVSPRNPTLDAMMPSPFKRKVVMRLPQFLKPAPENYAFILGLNSSGKVVYNFQDSTPEFAQITSVQQLGNVLYLGSLAYNGIGIFKLL